MYGNSVYVIAQVAECLPLHHALVTLGQYHANYSTCDFSNVCHSPTSKQMSVVQ